MTDEEEQLDGPEPKKINQQLTTYLSKELATRIADAREKDGFDPKKVIVPALERALGGESEDQGDPTVDVSATGEIARLQNLLDERKHLYPGVEGTPVEIAMYLIDVLQEVMTKPSTINEPDPPIDEVQSTDPQQDALNAALVGRLPETPPRYEIVWADAYAVTARAQAIADDGGVVLSHSVDTAKDRVSLLVAWGQ